MDAARDTCSPLSWWVVLKKRMRTIKFLIPFPELRIHPRVGLALTSSIAKPPSKNLEQWSSMYEAQSLSPIMGYSIWISLTFGRCCNTHKGTINTFTGSLNPCRSNRLWKLREIFLQFFCEVLPDLARTSRLRSLTPQAIGAKLKMPKEERCLYIIIYPQKN